MSWSTFGQRNGAIIIKSYGFFKLKTKKQQQHEIAKHFKNEEQSKAHRSVLQIIFRIISL